MNTLEDGVDFHHSAVGFAGVLDVQQQGSELCGSHSGHFIITQHRVNVVIQIALKAGNGIAAAPHRHGGDEHLLAVLPNRQDFGGFRFFLGDLCRRFCFAENFLGFALLLKLSGNLSQLPVNGFLAPSIRWIPAFGEDGTVPVDVTANLVENLPGFVLLFFDRCHEAHHSFCIF